MKNYLGNLIARHLNQVEVLQPRLASRFEPQSSVLQGEVPGPEISESAVAAEDIFAADSAIAATEIERRVESPPVQPSRSTEQAFDSSGPRPAIHNDAATPPSKPENFQPSVSVISQHTDGEPTRPAELTTPTIVVSERRDKSTAPATGSHAHPVRSAETPSSETPSAPSVAAEPRLTKSTDQVATAEDTEHGTPRESGPARVADKRSRRAVPTKSNQTLTPAPPVDFQPEVLRTETETRKRSAVPARESSPPISSVPHSESHRSTDRPKPRHADFPAERDGSSPGSLPAVVIPGPEAVKLSAVESAERESQVSPNRPVRFSEEVRQPRQTQRAPSLETSVVRSPPNDPMSAGTVSPGEIKPVETGPTINVTIGRIEVRATTQTPEARPQKQRREQQVLSLDEYLSQRATGGR